ncbi:MAG TPA: iron transporter, partial [Caldilineae bacterium]|nr:iron transporter [Caldilineae bacterium]
KQARTIKSELEASIDQASRKGAFAPLFLLAFLVIIREGVELALFLTAAAYSSSENRVLLGAAAGLSVAAALGSMLYSATSRVNLRRFFQVTGILLLFFAAGLVAHGVHEFNEIGWIPTIIDPLWNINHLLDEKSTVGEMLKALFGYNGNPSLTEATAYWLYIVIVFLALQWPRFITPPTRKASAPRSTLR